MLFAWWWACGVLNADRGIEGSEPPLGPLLTPLDGVASTEEVGRLTIVAMGDIMIHREVERAAVDMAAERQLGPRQGYDVAFEGLRGLVGAADLAFANLETPVSPSKFRPRRPRVFNADPLVVDSLVATGFDLVSLANNHAFDQGPEGLDETMDVLGERSLGYVGVGASCESARSPIFVERNGVAVAFLAATEILNEDWNVRPDATCTSTLDPADLLARTRAAKNRGADFVVVSLHWGDEYEPEPGPVRRRIAHRLVDGGVDVVLGHHAHVLQPIEIRTAPDGRLGLVAYGLGNLISNQAAWYVPGVHAPRSARPRDGLALSFALSLRRSGEGEGALVRGELVDVHMVPLWTRNTRHYAEHDQDGDLRVLPMREAIDLRLGEGEEGSTWVTELRQRIRLVDDQVGPTFVP